LSATDAELVHKARDGDQAAFHELVDRYAGSMFRLAYALVGNAQDAEDVAQETFLGVFRGLQRFEERSSLKTWLTRILLKQAARCRRNRKVRKMTSLEQIVEPPRPTQANGEMSAGASKMDLHLDVLAALDTLSPEHREIAVLREMQGMSYDEMAEALGVPRGTVESRLFRARQELKERLKGYRQ
jgi:RNA polymerase sigma-70 factor (ECF subfamily)